MSASLESSLVMCGFALAGGFGTLGYAWARQRKLTLILFAGLSFALSGYAFCTFLIQSATTSQMALLPIRTGELFGCVFVSLLPFLYCSMYRRPPGVLEYTTLACYLVFITLALSRPAGYEWENVTHMRPISYGSGVTHHLPAGNRSALAIVIHSTHVLVILYCVYIAWRGWRGGRAGLWGVLVLPLSLSGVTLFVIGDAFRIWHTGFSSAILAQWSAVSLYAGLVVFAYAEKRRDMADRERTQEKLQQSERQVQDIAANVPGVIFQFYAKATGDMGVSYVSPRSREILGIDADSERYYEIFTDCIVDDDRPRFLDSVRDAVRNVAVWEFEGRFRKPTGETIYLRGQSVPQVRPDHVLFNGLLLDTTERTLASAALAAGESRFKGLLQATQDAMFIVDREGCIGLVNGHAAEMFGYSSEELPGMSIDKLVPLRLRDGDSDQRSPYGERPASRSLDPGRELTALRKDGTEFPVEASLSYHVEGEQMSILCMVRNVTWRKQAQEALRESEEFIRGILDSMTPHVVVVDSNGTITAVNEAWKRFAVENGADVSAVGVGTDYFTALEAASGDDIADSRASLAGMRAILTGASDAFEITYACHSPDKRRWFHMRVTPMRGKLDRAVVVHTNVTDIIEAKQSLEQAYDASLEGWSRALDLRDKETQGHSQRVTDMTIELARSMGVQEDEIPHIRRGALLHDIGKIGIPDSILLKAGPLTEEEWVVMRRHPDYAFEMLRHTEFLQRSLDIPYCHHEKWDGTGYPRGLRGEQIPLAARIFAVVDVWDALQSDRPYRPAWPVEKVLAHIESRAGTHFDPVVTAAFRTLVTKRLLSQD